MLWQVDKLEQSDAVRSEEEAKATDKPLVFSKNPFNRNLLFVIHNWIAFRLCSQRWGTESSLERRCVLGVVGVSWSLFASVAGCVENGGG